MKKKIILSLIITATITSCSVQNRIAGGDKFFSRYQYNDAIYVYEGIKKKDANVLRKLAESYRLTHNSKKAEIYFEELTKMGSANSEDILHYAEVLKNNGKYKEALDKMNEYNSMVAGEKRIQSHLANTDYHTKLMVDNGQFNVKPINNNTYESEFSPMYYGDKVVFVSSKPAYSFTSYNYNWNTKNFLNLYSTVAKDKNNRKSFTKQKHIRVKGKLNRKYHEGPATFTPDGNVMIFTRDTYVKKKNLQNEETRVLELWMSKKDAKGKWDKATPLPFNNLNHSVGHATFSGDGKTMYFVSDMPGGKGGTDIWMAPMNSDGTFGAAINMGDKINTEGNEMFPFMHEKGVMLFSSNGHAGLGGLDVFMTTLKNGKVGKITNLGTSINTSQDDFGMILDKEMKSGYLSSNREGGEGLDDIYSIDVLKPLKFTKLIEGYTKDKKTAEILPGSIVKLYDSSGEVVAEVPSDEKGYYSFEVDPDQDFTLNGAREKYQDGKNTASTKTEEDIVRADLDLEKVPQLSLLCFVSDAKSGEALVGTKIKITDKNTGKVIYDVVTDSEGKWKEGLESKLMNTTLNYDIALQKEGYVGKTVSWKYPIVKEGEIKVHESLDLTLGKIEVGTDIGKLIAINPIYFDLGKYYIRPDAAVELDKIVAIMNQYPSIVIELGSHTDCRSSYSFNEKLSDNRAKSSAAYIVSKGISKDRIYGKGYGEKELLNGCACEGKVKSTCSEEEHQKNRRTVFKIVKLLESGVSDVTKMPGNN